MLHRGLGFIAAMPEEVSFFLRLAAYAIFIGTVYWFLTYEPAGTMLLYGFGLAAGFGTIVLGLGARARRRPREGRPQEPSAPLVNDAAAADARLLPASPASGPSPAGADGPFGDERGRIPGASIAPIILGVGISFAGLGLVFGPWLILAGLAIGLVGAADWAQSASAEYRAVEAGSRPVPEGMAEPGSVGTAAGATAAGQRAEGSSRAPGT